MQAPSGLFTPIVQDLCRLVIVTVVAVVLDEEVEVILFGEYLVFVV